MNIITLSEKYLEETTRMTNEVFPDDVHTQYSPERSFSTALAYEKEPELLAESQIEKISYWIVLGEGEVVGVTGLYRRKEHPKDEVWLAWYCVRADHRGKGLGRELLEWTIEKARAEGYKKFKLYTSDDPNEARAQELYEKLGFRIIAEEPNDHGGKTLYREKVL